MSEVWVLFVSICCTLKMRPQLCVKRSLCLVPKKAYVVVSICCTLTMPKKASIVRQKKPLSFAKRDLYTFCVTRLRMSKTFCHVLVWYQHGVLCAKKRPMCHIGLFWWSHIGLFLAHRSLLVLSHRSLFGHALALARGVLCAKKRPMCQKRPKSVLRMPREAHMRTRDAKRDLCAYSGCQKRPIRVLRTPKETYL